MKKNATWKYYFSEKQRVEYKAQNIRSGMTNPKCRTFTPNGLEYTFATKREELPSDFDDYELVFESQELPTERVGEPY